MKYYRFKEEIYNEPIHLLWNVTDRSLTQYMKRRFDYAYTRTGFLGVGRCLRMSHVGEGTSTVIVVNRWLDTNYSHSILAHECLHATHAILKDVGMNLTDDTVEAYCYLHDSLVRRCLNAIKKK